MISTSIIITKIRKPPYATGPSLHYDRPPSRRGATTRPDSPLPKSYTGSPPREQRKRHEVARHFSRAPREVPPKHYAYSAVYARGF